MSERARDYGRANEIGETDVNDRNEREGVTTGVRAQKLRLTRPCKCVLGNARQVSRG